MVKVSSGCLCGDSAVKTELHFDSAVAGVPGAMSAVSVAEGSSKRRAGLSVAVDEVHHGSVRSRCNCSTSCSLQRMAETGRCAISFYLIDGDCRLGPCIGGESLTLGRLASPLAMLLA